MDPTSLRDFAESEYGNGYSSEQYSPGSSSNEVALSPSLSSDTELAETVQCISQILMEENIQEMPTMFYDPLGLQITEKSFYDALGETYPYPDTITTDFPDSNLHHLLSHNMFQRGQEEASKFLPNPDNLLLLHLQTGSKAKKNHHEREDYDSEEERSTKHSALYAEDDESQELSEMFDKVLLSCCKDPQHQQQQRSGDTDAKSAVAASASPRGKKQQNKQKTKKKETVDLRTLLILCAQAVSACDSRTSQELLKQIRQNSSPLGDASQRLAHFFANALEARLAGTATTGFKLWYSALLANTSAADILKAYKLNLTYSPFKKLSMFFANKTIFKAAKDAACLHIVDFGILYGFQWPILIQHLATREGGPPKLRITGIEYPQSGSRPTERIEETGRRLEKYCKRFGVPFEYNAIASEHWESIRIEDIDIRSDEVLAVNCLTRFKNLMDETVEVDCPRNGVLRLIRKMNPTVFVQSIANGAYNAPFFVTRFREALFHFSALFDALDANIPRANEERLMYEREFYGREVMNVIACEGADRVERPETYKQWQVRNARVGFRKMALDEEIMRKLREKLKGWYHKDFVIDEDNNWMLQGWKGRIVYASSCWVPNSLS